ncbi:MAG: 3-oxoacyl-[acyl-carrier-protein] reductase [Deltaproteobacteria bacterium]|nr:3-oxoacyl-[acyl-carrier-protein] reductase [Deltaproteobacteria bacterium]
MSFGLEGKVALVTGASRGIGKDIALMFAAEGADVAFSFHSNESAADEVEAEIKRKGRRAMKIRCAVEDLGSAEAMVKEVKHGFGPIDILVNNAGILRDKFLINMEPADWLDVINTNLASVFNVTRPVAFSMMRRKKGRIINMASLNAIIGSPGQSNYTAAKAGVIGFTKSLARELAPFGINVNAVAPGYIETDMLKTIPEETLKGYLGYIPSKRFGRPSDVAGAVIFLASSLSDYITGQVIKVDGGIS